MITESKSIEGALSEIKAIFEVEQQGRVQTFWIRKPRIVIGSVESADLKLSNSKVAPIHAFLEIKFQSKIEDCTARLIDLASVSGVKVNGKLLVNDVIRSGDVIEIGEAKLRFSFGMPKVASNLSDQALLLIDGSTVTSIFDYRSERKDALEVVYSWKGLILDVEHFVEKQSVVLGGTSEEDFIVPPVFANGSAHYLAERIGDQWKVYIDSKMRGVLYLEGELHSLQDYRREKFGSDARGSITLGKHDFVKIEAGEISFYLSQTAAPPLLKHSSPIVTDPFLGKTLLLSLATMGLILIGVSRMDVASTEPQPVPEAIATILYHPEKYSVMKRPEEKHAQTPEEKTEQKKQVEIDFTKKEQEKKAQSKSSQPGKKQIAQGKAKSGAGAKAKGAEGKRGNKNAAASDTPQTAATRTSPQLGNARGGTTSQTQDNGNVQMLKGATNKILDLLGGSGQKLGNSGSKLQGFGGFSTQGNGGNALQGSGKGGGGNADTLLGGTGTHGRGGGNVGTGLGAEGTGAGIVGGKTRVELNMGGGDETVVIGSIDRDAIAAAIAAHKYEFSFCYERELNSGHPTLAGKVVTAFVIGGSGRASQLAVASSSIGSPSVERCVLSVISRIQFPQPAGGVPVTIKYPFAFNGGAK